MRDVNAPARAPSAYMLFCDSNRKKVTKNNPDCSMTELSTIFGQMWSEIDEKTKQPFMKKSCMLKDKRYKEMESYKLSPEYAEYQKRNRTDRLIRKYATQLGVKKVEFCRFPLDPNAPKRPASAFFCYSNDVRSSVAKNNPNNKITENGKIIGINWKKLTKTQKGKYEKMAIKEKSKYDDAMKKYEKTNNFKKYNKLRAEYESEKKISNLYHNTKNRLSKK